MTKRALRGSDFPALSGFLRGYLHEDFPEVHGSAVAAAVAFCADADAGERRELAKELETLVEFAANRPARQLQRFVTRELGSRWQPTSPDDIVELLEAIRATF